MKIALFSDVHGRLRLVLRMLQCWQIGHRTRLDAALLAGDLGCFPDESRFDRATRRWVERDPEEAGFPRYFMRPAADVEAAFSGMPEHGAYSAVTCPILFVAGNHEDFEYLRACRGKGSAPGMPLGTFPVDCYGRTHCIDDGAVVALPGRDGERLRVAGLWGVENSPPGSPKGISREAAQRLIDFGKGRFDLLLTHDVPGHSYTGHSGSTVISSVLRACEPPLHVFGHAHPVEGRHEFFADPVPTRSWIFEDVNFGKDCSGNLRGSMGVLHWEPGQDAPRHRIGMVEDEWLLRMRHRSWQHVWPSMV